VVIDKWNKVNADIQVGESGIGGIEDDGKLALEPGVITVIGHGVDVSVTGEKESVG